MKKELEKELKQLISDKLQQLRKANNFTIEQLAEKLSIDYSVMHNIITGTRLPRITTLYHISKTLNISLDDWFKNINFEKKANLDKNNVDFVMLYNFKKLDNSSKDFVIKVLQGLNAQSKKQKT